MAERIKKIPSGWIILGLAFLAWWAFIIPIGILIYSFFS